MVDFAGGESARQLTFRAALCRLPGRSGLRRSVGPIPVQGGQSLGARLALIVGPDEAVSSTVGIKDLRAADDGEQDTVGLAAVVDEVRRRLSS